MITIIHLVMTKYWVMYSRNSASEDVEQHLQFCGSEGGKLHALRDILRKVSLMQGDLVLPPPRNTVQLTFSYINKLQVTKLKFSN